MAPHDIRILVVDDMISSRMLVKQSLTGFGFKNFFEAENGVVALEVLNRQFKEGRPIELILCDWNMPKMNGIDLLNKVRATPEFKDMPFIMVTAEGTHPTMVEAEEAGVSGYVSKPFTDEELSAAVTSALAKK